MRLRAVSFLLCLCFHQASVFAQQNIASDGQAPQRDPQALAVVNQAIALLGGQSALAQIHDCAVQGTATVPQGGPLTSGPFRWQNAESEFRYEYPTIDGIEVLISNHGKQMIESSGGNQRVRNHSSDSDFPIHLPGLVLLRQVLNTSYSFTLLEPVSAGGQSIVRVRTVLESTDYARTVTPQIWSFDAATGLPVSVEYVWLFRSDTDQKSRNRAVFDNFRAESGVLLPHRITVDIEGSLIATFDLKSVLFNTNIATSTFETSAAEVKQ